MKTPGSAARRLLGLVSGSESTQIPRRNFLQIAWVSAGGLLGSSACGSEDPPLAELESAEFFPQSIASGDPRPKSVVLWTRVVDKESAESDRELELTLALDPEMRQRVELEGRASVRVKAEGRTDHCVKVRVGGLDSGRYYYYRFTYRTERGNVSTRIGRTKTAPAEDADVLVRFAVASCQNYDQKYYYAYRLILERELDFVVHLGDYVYESGSREGSGGRLVVFGHPEEALDLGNGRLVARSVDNYRDLYRTTRSDPDLQRLHESLPMIAIWDDHEFSNDCHGATATYDDGRTDETDFQRRAAADQAWFEYMPLDDLVLPARALDPTLPFPEDFAIHRSFVFGRHLELVMTDVRRNRPDHVIAEDAFPGAIFATEEEVLANEGVLPETPPVLCVDISEYDAHARFFREQADALDFRPDAVAGLLSLPYLNALLEELADPEAPPMLDPEASGVVRGYAYHQLLKSTGFSSVGARYLVAADPFGVLSRKRYRETDGASERLLGESQRAWFLDTLRRSTRTFKLWGSSLCLMPRQLDLTGVGLVPEELQTRIILSVEDWDGCPNERAALLGELAQVKNVVVLSGDLHCFFVGTPFDPDAPGNRVVEFVTGAVSSSTWLDEIRSIVASDPSLPPSVGLAASGIGALLSDPVRRPNPHLAFQELESNGLTVFEAGGEALTAELVFLPPELVARAPNRIGESLGEQSRSDQFHVDARTGELGREIQGRRWRWDGERSSWVAG